MKALAAALFSIPFNSAYLTRDGLHYSITLNIGGQNVPGEDTFFYVAKKLFLVSSATIGNEVVKCEGAFAQK